MARRTARLQVPIDEETLEELQHLAAQLGFDSVPAMVRFWAKGEIMKRSQATGLNRHNAVVLRYVELILAMKPQPPSPSSALHNLVFKLQQARHRQVFKYLPLGSTSDKIFVDDNK